MNSVWYLTLTDMANSMRNVKASLNLFAYLQENNPQKINTIYFIFNIECKYLKLYCAILLYNNNILNCFSLN